MLKKHNTEFGRRTSQNSGAPTVMIRKLVQRRKLFSMSFCTTYWKGGFFQCHLRVNLGHYEKYAIETRKVCISAENDIQKICSLMLDKLEISICQIKKESSNLAQK